MSWKAPARQAALRGGLSNDVAALTINKVCGSGLKAVMLAAQGIATGDIEIAVAGGMESMSNCPYLLTRVRDGLLEYAESTGAAMLITSHNMDEVQRLAHQHRPFLKEIAIPD